MKMHPLRINLWVWRLFEKLGLYLVSPHPSRLAIKNKVKYLFFVAAVVYVAVAYHFVNPGAAVANTLATATVEDVALHRAELGDTVFIYYIQVDNPTLIPVTIEKAEITLLVNGTDHLSRVMRNEPLTVNPGITLTLQKLVYLAGSPIGYQTQGRRNYRLEATVEVFASAESLGMRAEESRVLTDQQSWTYVKVD